ncbi:MAG: hypothetical protein BGP04_00780 [Rhizobiales bacterium 62-17]|nr:hypothetical protein [Hyphomicrobiales bacterium]OJY03999.1 MAG: hypothetical protein BGP04_00780 [Rhizobiales bacterium 62-17]
MSDLDRHGDAVNIIRRTIGNPFVAYFLAFILGIGVTWLILSALTTVMFSPNGLDNLGIMALQALSPMAGLAAFQTVFGLLTRRWRGWRFWAIAPLVTYFILVTILLLVFIGYVSIIEAIVLALIAIFTAGLIALGLRQRSV